MYCDWCFPFEGFKMMLLKSKEKKQQNQKNQIHTTF